MHVGSGGKERTVRIDEKGESPDSESGPGMRMRLGLSDLFDRQDTAVLRNYAAVSSMMPLTERVLSTALDVTFAVNDRPELGAAAPDARVRANLLHAATAGLVTMTRLALFGDHVAAMTIGRLAFENAYHAEFFRHRPDLAVEWDRSGQETDLDTRRKLIEKFNREHQVRTYLEKRDDPGRTRSRLFHEFSTFGAHANPVTTHLRLSIPPAQGANLGFMSVGKTEATQLVMGRVLSVGAYVVSEMLDSLRSFMEDDLIEDCETIAAEYDTLRASLPATLDMMR